MPEFFYHLYKKQGDGARKCVDCFRFDLFFTKVVQQAGYSGCAIKLDQDSSY